MSTKDDGNPLPSYFYLERIIHLHLLWFLVLHFVDGKWSAGHDYY